MKHVASLCLLLFSCTWLLAQQPTQINVIVKDQVTGFAIKDATVQLRTPEGKSTAMPVPATGKLELPALKGTYRFTVAAKGYQPIETYFETGKESLIEANVNLDPIAFDQKQIPPVNPNQVVIGGYLRDGDANTPLGNAVVTVGNQITTTNGEGYFSILLAKPAKAVTPGVAPEQVTIKVTKPGYVTHTIQNLYAFAGQGTIKVALTSVNSARARQGVEEVEVRTHGLFDRTETDEQQRYASPANAKADAALAATVPSSIRVGTSCSCTSCSVVQVMSLESYTQTGLDDEWISGWGAASLQAGAVAYRTYGAWYVLHPVASSYDIAATTCNQAWESDNYANTRNAAIATAGIVLLKNGAIFRSEYSAENNNSGCGNGYAGTGSTWPCISDSRCAGRAKNGHGRGMCQWGSSFWASDKTYTWILDHYYTPGGVTVQNPTPPPATTINFTVKDQLSGAALASTSVSITAPGGTVTTRTTDASGKLSFGANSGQHTFAFSKSGYSTLRTNFTAGSNATITADINLDATSSARAGVLETAPRNSMEINGYVRDAALNQAVAGTLVQIGSQTATTDANGYFSVQVPAAALSAYAKPGTIGIRLQKNGYAPYSIENFFVLPDTYTLQVTLQPNTQSETKELLRHGLFSRTDLLHHNDDETPHARAEAAAAATLPTSIRVVTSCECSTCTSLSVQVMSLETYVQAGLDDEWLSSWNAASLQAGAVAYRSKGAWYAQHPVNANYDLSAAACHQTWQNDRSATVRTAAIATAGVVLVKNGAIVKAEYCAESNNAGCGNGFSGTGTTWPCIADSRCAGRTTSGHGRGMCQWGSSFWGTDQTYSWILNHYYNADSTTIQSPGALTVNKPVASSFRTSPNPVTGTQVKLEYNVAASQTATITLLDNSGHAIRSQQVTLQPGQNAQNFYTGKLKAGVYTVQIRYGNKIETQKIIAAP